MKSDQQNPSQFIADAQKAHGDKSAYLAVVLPIKVRAEMQLDKARKLERTNELAETIDACEIIWREAEAFLKYGEYTTAKTKYESLILECDKLFTLVPAMRATMNKDFEVDQQAAEQKNAEALYGLAVQHATGQGVAKDIAKAAELFRKAAVAADQGDADAQYRIGTVYSYGYFGVNIDEVKAKELIQKAAAQGHLPARAWMRARKYEIASGEAKAVNRDNTTAQYNSPQCSMRIVCEDGISRKPGEIGEYRANRDKTDGFDTAMNVIFFQ